MYNNKTLTTMSHTYQTSSYDSNNAKSRRRSMYNTYCVTVEDFDNESYDFTVEATSVAQANEIVTAMCSEQFIDIYNMCIYTMG